MDKTATINDVFEAPENINSSSVALFRVSLIIETF